MNKRISLAAGVIIEKDDQILMVYEKGHWGLPKGEREQNESLSETAVREAREETGLHVALKEVAFVTEFKAKDLGYFLQVFYAAEIINGKIEIMDPDNEIEEVTYIHTSNLRSKMKFRPRLLPLEHWLNHGNTSYHFYDLDKEPYFIEEG